MTLPSAPVQFSDSEYAAAGTSPEYGEHTAQVLADLGFSAQEIDALHTKGVAIRGD